MVPTDISKYNCEQLSKIYIELKAICVEPAEDQDSMAYSMVVDIMEIYGDWGSSWITAHSLVSNEILKRIETGSCILTESNMVDETPHDFEGVF